MAEQFTITIPESLYRRARALAQSRNRSLDGLIADALDRGLLQTSAEDAYESSFATEGEDGEKLTRETAAYEAMHAQLLAQYAGEFVAIFNGQLIDHDTDELALLDRLDAEYPEEVVLMKRVLPSPMQEFFVRSPRLERD